eukprot:760623-Hanusia_phi.AAC.1
MATCRGCKGRIDEEEATEERRGEEGRGEERRGRRRRGQREGNEMKGEAEVRSALTWERSWEDREHRRGSTVEGWLRSCLLYTSPSPRDRTRS